ncbi:MAG: ATP-binding cassette domain-containing protein [Candidatus Hydrogenedentota bacterium]|nr:MAG: ATP-binding cassette domain-containing protein [Candidatus Hydrogenedentota bacterium]
MRRNDADGGPRAKAVKRKGEEGNGAVPFILEAFGLQKSFLNPDGSPLPILKDASIQVEVGRTVAVMGSSGSGKTTLLHILAGIESPDGGEIRSSVEHPGLVFQHHYLMPEFTAWENVAMAARLAGKERRAAREIAEEYLRAVGLLERRKHLPTELSGGELARAGLARALAAESGLILADEPTGSLDEETSEQVTEVLFRTVRDRGAALVVVTHDPKVAARADRLFRLEHGRLIPETERAG